MKSCIIRNGVFSSLFVAMALTGMNLPLQIHAEDLIERDLLDYTEETGGSFSANYRQIYPSSKFDTMSTVTISGSEYKNLINKNILTIPEYKGIPSNRPVSLTGLGELQGTIEYTITSTLPLSSSESNPKSLVNCTGSAVKDFQADWIPADNGEYKGIRIMASINWGELIDSLPYLKEFREATFSSLKLDIEVSGLTLANPANLHNKTSFTLTGAVTQYTLSTPEDKKVTISYLKSEKDDNGFPIETKYSGGTPITEKINSGFPKPSATIYIGEKNILSNTGNSSSLTQPNKPSVDNSSNDQMIVLRLYNPATGEHLFTSNPAERTHLVDNGWKNEYCEWNTPSNSDTPIYRLCNPNNDDHHYTTNAAEKDMLVQLGWRYEGVHFYSAAKDEGIPVYRVYNPNATSVGSHHYTSSKSECDALVSYGWNFEGIAWYGVEK